jgi:hypothetical protein
MESVDHTSDTDEIFMPAVKMKLLDLSWADAGWHRTAVREFQMVFSHAVTPKRAKLDRPISWISDATRIPTDALAARFRVAFANLSGSSTSASEENISLRVPDLIPSVITNRTLDPLNPEDLQNKELAENHRVAWHAVLPIRARTLKKKAGCDTIWLILPEAPLECLGKWRDVSKDKASEALPINDTVVNVICLDISVPCVNRQRQLLSASHFVASAELIPTAHCCVLLETPNVVPNTVINSKPADFTFDCFLEDNVGESYVMLTCADTGISWMIAMSKSTL